jgi:hypothetical protein
MQRATTTMMMMMKKLNEIVFGLNLCEKCGRKLSVMHGVSPNGRKGSPK